MLRPGGDAGGCECASAEYFRLNVDARRSDGANCMHAVTETWLLVPGGGARRLRSPLVEPVWLLMLEAGDVCMVAVMSSVRRHWFLQVEAVVA